MAKEVKVVPVRAESLVAGDIIRWTKGGPWKKVERIVVEKVEGLIGHRFEVWVEGFVARPVDVGQFDIVDLQREVGDV